MRRDFQVLFQPERAGPQILYNRLGSGGLHRGVTIVDGLVVCRNFQYTWRLVLLKQPLGKANLRSL